MLHPRPHLRAAGDDAVELRGVSAGYEQGPVLRDIDLRVPHGDFVGLVGPSGSGKTTLLRVLLGAARLYAGEVRIAGERPSPGRQRVAYVPQLETVDWNFPVTAEQVVLMGSRPRRRWLPWPDRDERERALELMDRLGLGGLEQRHIRRLSGGQQQRVFLARALASEPSVLLLDEPTSGVDIKTRDEVLHLLDELNHQGITIILTTHELNAVAAHLPWVVCINETVIAEGAPADVFTSEILEATYHAEMPVLEYEGMTLVAERPHVLGGGARGREPSHPAGRAAADRRDRGSRV
jgi:zinc/manganese transport system ATP-binding protein/zinc transport system ATP-binding protein